MAECLGTPEGFHGSLLCMSPQVFHGLSYTQKCDVWSLGIVFYEMITQISVYGKEPTKQAIVCQMESIRNGKLSFPETKLITEECKQVIVSCLQW